MDIALCRKHVAAGNEWWTSGVPAEEQAAARICNTGDGGDPCPIRNTCLEVALDTEERHGVWGGLTPQERNRLRPMSPQRRTTYNTKKMYA
jgi:WhiB family redox-sensing transcriptional regulator